MAQDCYKINGSKIWQPDRDIEYSWETTYTEDSGRDMNGSGHFTPMFTVRQYSYTASNIPVAEVAKILKIIDGGRKFTLHTWSPRDAKWKDVICYVGQSQGCTIGTLESGQERYTSFSFNCTEVDA